MEEYLNEIAQELNLEYQGQQDGFWIFHDPATCVRWSILVDTTMSEDALAARVFAKRLKERRAWRVQMLERFSGKGEAWADNVLQRMEENMRYL